MILVALACVVVIGYGLFEARRFLEGPQISITSPTNGSATSSPAVHITGTAQNISFLTINDAPAYTNKAGYFSATLSPPTGYTVVTVAAVDRFGRRASQSVSIQVLNYCSTNS